MCGVIAGQEATRLMDMVLEVEDVRCVYDGLAAVDGASLSIRRGTTVGLVGPNGAGKTTLLNSISGLAPMVSGRIVSGEHEISSMPPHRRAEHGLSRSYQLIRLFPDLKVIDNVKLGLHTQRSTSFAHDVFHTPKQRRAETRAKQLSMEALNVVGMDNYANTYARYLSFGQGRRVELARVLVGDPKLILLDEPTTGVDADQIGRLSQAIRKIRDSANPSMLIVEHNLRFVREVCEEVVVMNFGKVIAKGPVDETLRNPEVVAAYLGEGHTA